MAKVVRTMTVVPEEEPSPSTTRVFGAWVRELRRRRGLTQVDIAARAGISVTYLSGIETGQRNPTLTVVARLAHALGVRPSQLVARLDQIDPQSYFNHR